MNINDLSVCFSQCREIEFRLNGKNYFLQPNYNNGSGYILYYCENAKETKEIFRGTNEDILKYNFENKLCLQNDFDLFEFSFVL